MSETQNVTDTENYIETHGDVNPSNSSVGPVEIGESDHEFVGQFFHDKAFDKYFVVKYIDRDIVVKQTVNDEGRLFGYNMEKRSMFDKQYKTSSGDAGYNKASEEEAMDDPYGEKAEQKKREEELDDQITEVSDFHLIKGMGSSKVDEFVEKYETLEDVSNATDDELKDVKGVGRTLIKRIRDEVGHPDVEEEPEEEEPEEEEAEPEETPDEEEESKELNEDRENMEEEGEQEDEEEDDDSDDGWDTLLESDDSDWSMDAL
jgi:hypothetical protein